MARVLLVEDDVEIAVPLTRALVREGHEVSHVIQGQDAIKHFSTHDVVILDLGLPDVDGLTVCRQMRSRNAAIPVIVLSARAQEIDLVIGLDAGADDYVTKPFRTSELMARLRAVLRRSHTKSMLLNGPLALDFDSHEVSYSGQSIALTPKEFELLALLMEEMPSIVSRDTILREVWQTEWHGATKTIDMHISTLRRKLQEAGAQKELIATIRGSGFRMLRA